jgi:hypothetical protein
MSSLIDQAILDATQLREAALRTAESQIIEKYATEIKEAMTSILDEQDDEEMDLGSVGAGLEEPAEPGDEEIDQIPTAGMPEEDTTLTFNADELRHMLDKLENDPEDHVDTVKLKLSGFEGKDDKDLRMSPVEDLDEEMEFDLDEEEDLDEGYDIYEEDEEEEELDESDIRSIVEELVVDITGEYDTGWAGRPEKDRQNQEKVNLAKLADTARQQELKDLQDGMKKLAGVNESIKNKNSVLEETVSVLKQKLEELSVANTKLAFQNEALMNPSLNRRQKEQIVESIRKASTSNDAKVIYEALQGNVDSTQRRKETLNEIISKPSHSIPRREIESNSAESGLKNRFQLLAGIK